MPVNIRLRLRRLESIAGRRRGDRPTIDAAAPHVGDGRRAGTGEQRAAVVAAEQRRREVEHVAVDEAGAVERAGDGGAALDHHLHDASPTELVEHVVERRPSSSSAGWTLAPVGRVAEHDAQRVVDRRTWRTVSDGSSAAHGAGADEDRVALGPQPVGVGAGRVAGDPLARAVGRGGAAVEGGRQLQHDLGPAGAAVLE